MKKDHQLVVDAKNVELSYRSSSGNGTTAVSGLDLSVRKGSFHTIIGPSGCGKSTILKAIAGLMPQDLEKEGSSLKVNLVKKGLERISMSFQSPTLLPWLSVEENALLPYRIAGEEVTDGVLERLKDFLHLVGLSHASDAMPHELSGGMAMRAALVRAFIPRSELILLDEPFAALDEWTRSKLCMELESLWQAAGNSVIFVTHNISEAVLLSDEISLMSNSPGTVVKNFHVPFNRPRSDLQSGNEDYLHLVDQVRNGIVEVSSGKQTSTGREV